MHSAPPEFIIGLFALSLLCFGLEWRERRKKRRD